MKKSIQFSLLMALLIIMGPIKLEAQTIRIETQDRLKEIEDKYGFFDETNNKSDERSFSIRIDSMISTEYNSEYEKIKELRSYNDNGELQSRTSLILNNSVWELYYRNIYYYNEDGKEIERLYERWEENEWVSKTKYTYTYYDFGKSHTSLTEKFENDVWVNQMLSVFGYDSNNNFNEYLRQIWEANEWVNYIIVNATNNEDGNWITEVAKSWQEENWVNLDSASAEYNDSGKQAFIDTKIWEDNEWVNFNNKYYYYDVEGRQTSYSSLNWNDNEYLKLRLDSITYNEFDLMDTRLIFLGDNTNEWKYSEKFERIYDENINLIEETIQLWENDQWNNGFYSDYSFDDGSITGIMYEWIDDNWESCQQFRLLNYVLAGEAFYHSYGENSMQIFYSDIQVGINNHIGERVHIESYPNPTNGLYYIKANNDEQIEQVSIYQLNSQLIGSYYLEGASEYKVDIRNQPNGVYLIKVQTNSYTTVLKTVKSN